MQNIFVYGTLLFPEITKKLTGKSFKTLPAVLPGFKIYCIKERDYPAIFVENGSETKGKILLDVEDSDLQILSFYEGDEYKKEKVTVLINGKPEIALAFVWAKENEFLENKKWDLHWFEINNLEHYLNIVIPETLDAFNGK